MTRLERKNRWAGTFNPERLAVSGLVFSVFLFIQPDIRIRLFILGFAAWAVWFSGRKHSVPTIILTMLGIIIANLLVPVGKKLFSIGPFPITETALLEGLKKAVSFEALIFISRACILPDLKLPGKIGAFFSEALIAYERILQQKDKIKISGFIKSIDEVLLIVYEESLLVDSNSADDKKAIPDKKKLKPGDIYILVAICLFSVSFFFSHA